MRLAVYDDHPVIVHGLQAMLAAHKDIELIGCYHELVPLMQGLNAASVDVLIAICREGDCYNNLPVTLHKLYPQLSIVVLVSETSVSKLKNLISHGRKGYIMENADRTTLIEAIEAVHRGEIYIDAKLKERLLISRIQPLPNNELSGREKEVLQLIADEYTTPEIASRLNLSPRTVENHRVNIISKLGVRNTAGLVRYAMRAGLVT